MSKRALRPSPALVATHASHAVRDHERIVEGVPRLRLSRRVGRLLGRSGAFARIPQRARAAFVATSVQQRTRAVGRADGARGLPEHPRARFARRTPARVASRCPRGGRTQPVSRARGADGRALYAFIGVRPDVLPNFDDQEFALDLLEHKHVLVAPGSSFNVPYRNYFRITNLPDRAASQKCSHAGAARELRRRRAAREPPSAAASHRRSRRMIELVEIVSITI
jgi:hypothetical protein